MNRRQFLQSSASAAVAMSARSYARVLGANDRVGLGVIGLGRRGLIVSSAFCRDPRVNLVALSDVYGEQTKVFRQAVIKGGQQPPAFVNHKDLLAREDVDAVLIATPDHLHVTMAKDAIAANKHIYLEKPTFHNWDERQQLINAKAGSKVVLQCGMQQRSGAHYMQAKQDFFKAGKLGHVVFARAVWHNFPWQTRHIVDVPKPPDLNWDLFLGPAPKVPYRTDRYTAWRYFPDYGHGLLADILTHWVDVAQWMLDDPNPLAASALGGIYQLHDGRENPDTVSASLQYHDWNLNFESSVLSIRDDAPSVYFEGTEGSLNITREGFVFTPNKGESVSVKAQGPLELAHTANFLDAVTQGKPVNAPLAAGLEATLPVQMALRSYWSHKIVSAAEMA